MHETYPGHAYCTWFLFLLKTRCDNGHGKDGGGGARGRRLRSIDSQAASRGKERVAAWVRWRR